MLRQVLRHIVNPHRRFFFPGVRSLTKFNVLFAREIVLENAMEYVLHNRLEGCYAEFGVWQGRTLSAAWHLARERRLAMDFWVFDSFRGLP
ncbi:MAG: TylF/MycF/NovP-related O-methyltransferase, partial [Tepidiformaceae bacterium]